MQVAKREGEQVRRAGKEVGGKRREEQCENGLSKGRDENGKYEVKRKIRKQVVFEGQTEGGKGKEGRGKRTGERGMHERGGERDTKGKEEEWEEKEEKQRRKLYTSGERGRKWL